MAPLTPFRPPPPRPYSSTRPTAGPRFASTPRFLFSQPNASQQAQEQDESLSDAIESPSTVRYADRDTGATVGRGDVIEDVGESEGESEYNDRLGKDGIFDGEEPNSSSAEPDGDADSEFEDLFGPPTAQRTKRRRILPDATTESRYLPQPPKLPGGIVMSSSPPELQSSLNEPPLTPFPSRQPEPQPQSQNVALGTPRPTPATGKPSFRNHPRFVLSGSSSQQPSSASQSRTPFTPGPAPETPFSTQQRRKPAFVLPRSPSPSEETEDATLPTPFSPSSRTLRRRGRARNNAPSYVPGGMAAEVRSWVLEMGTKREQLNFHSGAGIFASKQTDPKNYLLTARIMRVRQTSLGTSGPLAFTEGQILPIPDSGPGNDSRNILLMGLPLSRTGLGHCHEQPQLKRDDMVGVYRGLNWDIELSRDELSKILENGDTDVDLAGSSELQASNTNTTAGYDRWLMVMEWDLLG